MTRGYLGEMAFVNFLQKNYNISARLDHESGNIKEYLASDIREVRTPYNNDFRKSSCKIGIKTSKWNGIWLDLPGSQFEHSDYHVFVKIGADRDHLFSFFKSISVFKDKILKKGCEVGSLTEKESSELFEKLPNFSEIPAYICGFIKKTHYSFEELPYRGKKGRKNFTITSWNGQIKKGDLEKIKEQENVSGSVKFEGIGNFSHDDGYLFNTGNLLWKTEDWGKLIGDI